jgi:GT2 family glycosyltransferase
MTPEAEPFLSVVIPTHERPEQLTRCLEALARQDYPRERFSLVVVDDGSPTPVSEVLAGTDGPLRVDLIRQRNAGPAAARNAGARRARGSLLVFTDDDCTPEPGWLRALAAAHVETPDAALGGSTVNALHRNRCSAASQLLIDFLYSYFNADPSSARFVASNNFAVPAETFLEVGGFPTGFPLAAGEDRELCDRWIAHGHSIRYVPAASVLHHHGLTLGRFLRQHFGYGRGGFQFQRARARRGEKTRIEPLRFYVDLLLYPAKRLSPGPALVTTALFFCAQAANAAGFFWESARTRWRVRAADVE